LSPPIEVAEINRTETLGVRFQRAVARINSTEETQTKKIARSYLLFLLNMRTVPNRTVLGSRITDNRVGKAFLCNRIIQECYGFLDWPCLVFCHAALRGQISLHVLFLFQPNAIHHQWRCRTCPSGGHASHHLVNAIAVHYFSVFYCKIFQSYPFEMDRNLYT